MTQEQFLAELAILMTKRQTECNVTVAKDEIEAQKCLLDAAKELFLYHDYAKTQVCLKKAIGHLDRLQRKSSIHQF